jgi:shikimate kinase
MQSIYLVGFMGTGKTAVGKELAKSLKFKFVDLDDLIVRKEKRAINDIFSQSGEPCFRKVEKEQLREIASQKNQVVSCGGGIVIDPENIALMQQSGRLIALTARPEVIFERTKNGVHRPLLNVADPLGRITELLNIRKPYYEKADALIDTSDLSVRQVVENILELTKE